MFEFVIRRPEAALMEDGSTQRRTSTPEAAARFLFQTQTVESHKTFLYVTAGKGSLQSGQHETATQATGVIGSPAAAAAGSLKGKVKQFVEAGFRPFNKGNILKHVVLHPPPPLPAPLLHLCKTPSKRSNDVFPFAWLVLDYSPGSPCRPIKHLRSHGRCPTSSAFVMVIKSGTKNEWWNNPIQRDLQMPFTKGPHIDNRQFHISFTKSGLIEYERTGRGGLQRGSSA